MAKILCFIHGLPYSSGNWVGYNLRYWSPDNPARVAYLEKLGGELMTFLHTLDVSPAVITSALCTDDALGQW